MSQFRVVVKHQVLPRATYQLDNAASNLIKFSHRTAAKTKSMRASASPNL